MRCLALVLLFASFAVNAAFGGDRKFEAILIWATNGAEAPSDQKAKPVDAEIERKLTKTPLRWKRYFEINRKNFNAPMSQVTKVQMSPPCRIEVIPKPDQNAVEVQLIGQEKVVKKWTGKLPKGECFTIGADEKKIGRAHV